MEIGRVSDAVTGFINHLKRYRTASPFLPIIRLPAKTAIGGLSFNSETVFYLPSWVKSVRVTFYCPPTNIASNMPVNGTLLMAWGSTIINSDMLNIIQNAVGAKTYEDLAAIPINNGDIYYVDGVTRLSFMPAIGYGGSGSYVALSYYGKEA